MIRGAEQAAEIKRGRSWPSIERTDGRRIIHVTADLGEGAQAPAVVLEKLTTEVLSGLPDKYPGLGWGFGYLGGIVALDGVARLPHQDLLDFGRLAELLGYDRKVNTLDYPVSPRGFRILGRIPRLPRLVVQNIVREFRGLDEILAATDPELESVEGVGEIRAKDIREGLRRLQEINLVDRYLQT